MLRGGFAPQITTPILIEVASATFRSHGAPGARPHTGARLSDAAPAASDKHRLLSRSDGASGSPPAYQGASRRAVPGPDRGSIPIGSRLARLRIRSHGASGARPHTGARLSDAAPAASDKHRLLIGCRAGASHLKSRRRSLSEVASATSHPQPWRIGKPARIPGRAYRTPRQRLRISTASLSDVARMAVAPPDHVADPSSIVA